MIAPLLVFGGTRGYNGPLTVTGAVLETGDCTAPGGGVMSSASENEQAASNTASIDKSSAERNRESAMISSVFFRT